MRDELTRLNEQLQKLDLVSRQRLDVLALLNDLTQRVSDDTMLTRFELNNNVVRISGQGDNAAQLIQELGKQPGFRDVRAPMGIARASSGGKESFTIEFNVDAGPKAETESNAEAKAEAGSKGGAESKAPGAAKPEAPGKPETAAQVSAGADAGVNAQGVAPTAAPVQARAAASVGAGAKPAQGAQ
jgi:general secretion pathway protein L